MRQPARNRYGAPRTLKCIAEKSAEASTMAFAGRSGVTVQMFDLDRRQKLKSHTLQEPCVYWKWTSNTNLAMVTATSVWHWDMSSEGPTKLFDRAVPQAQVLHYSVSQDSQWCVLGVIQQGASGNIEGKMQLYNLERKLSQALEGFAAAFGQIQLPGREPAQIIAFHEKKATDPTPKLHVREVGRKNGPPFAVRLLRPEQWWRLKLLAASLNGYMLLLSLVLASLKIVSNGGIS